MLIVAGAYGGGMANAGGNLNPVDLMAGLIGKDWANIAMIALAISAFPGACFSSLIAANSFKTTMPKVNPSISVGIGAWWRRSGGHRLGRQSDLGVRGDRRLVRAGLRRNARRLPAVGPEMGGSPAGFNPAGWISWIVGFAVGAFNLVVEWTPALADWKDYVPVPPVAALVVGFVLYLILASSVCKAESWRCRKRRRKHFCGHEDRRRVQARTLGDFLCIRLSSPLATIVAYGRAASSPDSAGAYRRISARKVARGSLKRRPRAPIVPLGNWRCTAMMDPAVKTAMAFCVLLAGICAALLFRRDPRPAAACAQRGRTAPDPPADEALGTSRSSPAAATRPRSATRQTATVVTPSEHQEPPPLLADSYPQADRPASARWGMSMDMVLPAATWPTISRDRTGSSTATRWPHWPNDISVRPPGRMRFSLPTATC